MIRYLCLFVFLITGCRVEERKPVLVILNDAVVPTFALYDDGTIITLRKGPTFEDHFLTRTTPDAAKKAASLLAFDPAKMNSRYELSDARDEFTTVLWTPGKRIEIYGGWQLPQDWGGVSNPAFESFWNSLEESEKKMRESLPKEIREALLRIDRERPIHGATWLPSKIEVMFSPYEYAPEESVLWPKDWPTSGRRGVWGGGDDSFSVFLPSENLPQLRRFMATRRAKGAVLIGGKKMAAGYRFPFPGEAAWRR